MNRYTLPLPLQSLGINLRDDSLISDFEAARGTVNMSFKNGVPQTRRGYVKYSPFAFMAKSLIRFREGINKTLMAVSGGKLKKESGASFEDITGTLATDRIETLQYPCTLGYANAPYLVTTADAGTGTLAAGTYSYKVVAVTSHGETEPSRAVIQTVAANKAIKITWDKVATATGYKVYGRSAGAELLMATITGGSTVEWTDTGAVTPSGALPTTNTTPTSYTDKLFMLDGNKYQYYDTEHAAILDVLPYAPSSQQVTAYGENVLISVPDEINKQKYILHDNARIWVAGFGKLVRMSALGLPDYFPSTHVWKLKEDCTGMGHFMDEVFLFTENTTTLISGKTPDFSLGDKYIFSELPGGYGCTQHRTIAVGENAIYWANRRGVYRYRYLPSGFSIPECITHFVRTNGVEVDVSEWIEGITDWSPVFGVLHDKCYRLHLGGGKVIVFDTVLEAWSYHEYKNSFECANTDGVTLLHGGTGYIYKMEVEYDPLGSHGFDGLNDDDVAIPFVLSSKNYDFGKPANRKRFKEIFFTLFSDYLPYDIDVEFSIDDERYVETDQIINKVSRWGLLRFGDEITTKKTQLNYPIIITQSGRKYNLKYTLSCSGIDMAFALRSATLKYKEKEL